MEIISASFNNRDRAEVACDNLIDNGFRREDISVIMTDKTRDAVFVKKEDTGDKAAKGGLTGAVSGGILLGLLGAMTAIGSVVVPGAGLLASGPIVAALSGGSIGAASGGILGALLAAGFADDEAKSYEEDLKNGRAVIVVHAPDEMADRARSILRDAGAITKAA